MRVAVCGGRDFNQHVYVYDALDDLVEREGPIAELITGGATGADYWAESWAWMNKVPCRIFAADWKRHGRKAGPLRNQQILDAAAPDLLVAFPGGRGTADMTSRAKRAGVRVVEAVTLIPPTVPQGGW